MRTTLYKNTFGDKLKDLDLDKVLIHIKNGHWFDRVLKCRKALAIDKKQYTKLKTTILFAFTPSGVFSRAYSKKKGKRNTVVPPTKSDLLQYNKIVQVDFDNLDDFQMESIPDIVGDCQYTYASFISPSGKGIKVFVKVNSSEDQHKAAFDVVNDYYKKITKLKDSDKSCSNINRLCYVSADTSLVLNKQAAVFQVQTDLFASGTHTEQQSEVVPTADKKPSPPPVGDALSVLLVKVSAKMERDGLSYEEGQKHNYIKEFCINAFKYGIEEKDCLEACLNNFEGEEKRAKDLVEWTYTNYDKSKKGGFLKYESNKKTPNKNEYQAELFKEYTDLTETHTQFELPDFLNEEILTEEHGVANHKAREAVLEIHWIESVLKKDFDFRFNLMNGQYEYKGLKSVKYSPIEESALNSIYKHLLLRGVPCTPAKIKRSILSDFSEKQHPLKKLFIEWGAVVQKDSSDYIEEVANLVKTDAPKGLWNSVFKKWVVASVANVFVDDWCTNRTCPILVGGQDVGKTKFFRGLWPSQYLEYFYSGEINLKDRDCTLRLIDTFLIVVDEQIANLDNQKDWETFKGLISKDRVKVRRFFGTHDTSAPRISNFCGSVNPDEILQDPSGNSRFLTFKVTDHIDINSLRKIDIRKFWGQAFQLHKKAQKGQFHYLLDSNERRLMKKYQKQFAKISDEGKLILDMFSVGTQEDYDNFFSTTELWKSLVQTYPKMNISSYKVGAALKQLGFHRVRRKRESDGQRIEGWFVKNYEKENLSKAI